MLSQTFATIIFATILSSGICDTQGVYHIQPNGNLYQPLPTDVATPRFALWNPLQYFTLQNILQPAVTVIGVIVGLFTFLEITEWLFRVLAITKSKKRTATPTVEETNEIEEARRKRMISAEETERVVSSIEAAGKAYEQPETPTNN